jgi:hypothetical protein
LQGAEAVELMAEAEAVLAGFFMERLHQSQLKLMLL